MPARRLFFGQKKIGKPCCLIEVHASAFSLVEVVIAIAVFSFCLVTIIYLLGIGLNSSRASGQDSSLTAALQTTDALMRANSTNTLATTTTFNYYFDVNGNAVTNSSVPGFTYLVAIQRVTASSVSALTAVTNTTTTPFLVSPGATNSNRYFLWKVICAYPPPLYPQTNNLLIGETSYDP